MRTTASAPAASAQRRTVPAVPGVPDVREYGDQPRPGLEDLLEGHVQEPADPDESLRGDGRRDVRDHVLGGEVHAGPGVPGLPHDVGVPLGGVRRHEELDQRLAAFPRCPAASRTACGPSARNSRSFPRKFRLASRRAAETRTERGEISSGPTGMGSPLVQGWGTSLPCFTGLDGSGQVVPPGSRGRGGPRFRRGGAQRRRRIPAVPNRPDAAQTHMDPQALRRAGPQASPAKASASVTQPSAR